MSWRDDPIIMAAPPKPRWWKPRMLPNQPPECLPCGVAKIWMWLGMKWIGYPYPLRKRGTKYAGCGCNLWAKTQWLYFQWWFDYNVRGLLT